ncbi:hypothetical protein VP01_3017g3 [Puccinia sorghi]|uniref:Uncharacterized protein n=1 Tax=Puccinia sorghi TaxID=27349 RepID=A0A0L6V058_9BASI|nr:hypothetical protein VP01_3017g3 [Puccinia sorghi]
MMISMYKYSPHLYPKTPASPHPQLLPSPVDTTPASASFLRPPAAQPSALLRPILPPAAPSKTTLVHPIILRCPKALKILSFVYFGPLHLSTCNLSSAAATSETRSYCLAHNARQTQHPAPHQVAIKPPKSLFTHSSVSRTSKAWLTSDIPRASHREAKQGHFPPILQISNILSFCAKDPAGWEDNHHLGDGPPSPLRPVQPKMMKTPPVAAPSSTWKNLMSQIAYNNLLRMRDATQLCKVWPPTHPDYKVAVSLLWVTYCFSFDIEKSWLPWAYPQIHTPYGTLSQLKVPQA